MLSTSLAEVLADPLSDITRKERRNLLLASTAGAIVATMGLVPTKFSTLGIDFSPPAQNSFVILVALVIAYFVAAFLLYGVADFFVWRIKYQDYLVARQVESITWTEEDKYHYDEIHSGIPQALWLYSWSGPVVFCRAVFEFMFPLLAGVLSVCLLIQKIWHT